MSPLPVKGNGLALPPMLPPPDYDPAPSRNAFLTVMGVFAFFGACFLVVAAWIRTLRRKDRKRLGLNGFDGTQWYRRRSAFISPSLLPPSPKRRLVDIKFWLDRNRLTDTLQNEPLLRTSSLESFNNVYNTFGGGSRPIPRTPAHNQNWYSAEYSAASSEDVRQETFYRIPVPCVRSRIADRIKASPLSGSPSRRDQAKKTWTIQTPGNTGSKVSKISRAYKSYKKEGGWRSIGTYSARRKSTAFSNVGGGTGKNPLVRCWSTSRIGGFTYETRGLDVVLEEAGSTPERLSFVPCCPAVGQCRVVGHPFEHQYPPSHPPYLHFN
ncbi:hypothetical protein BDD12DRAFT_983232 [Trichophaea hybrida]|nr:hypothetical protein BDD12DRAFT_983232 [Trichophaea hybrida]